MKIRLSAMAIALVCAMGAQGLATAVEVPFVLKPLIANSNIGGAGTASANVTITTNAVGNDIVYSCLYTNVDLDGGGTANDALSWDMKVQGFSGASLNGGTGMFRAGTTPAQVVFDGTTGWSVNDTSWNRETLVFSVSNVVLTADAGYSAVFNGFDGLWLTIGTYYFGEGNTTNPPTLVTTANANTNFMAADPLLITPWGGERNRDLAGSFTVEYVIPPTLIGQDDFDGNVLYLSKINTNGINNSVNTWKMVDRSTVQSPNIIDTSVTSNAYVALNPADNIGFLQSDKTDAFFGMYRGGGKTLTYTFNIAGYTNLSLAMDWAASGDVPPPDIAMTYSIDGAGETTNFVVGTSGTDWIETMEIGTVVTNGRSASVTVNGVAANSLSDVFQTYNPTIAGAGSVLTVKLTMGSGVSGPAYGLDNLKLFGIPEETVPSGYDTWAAGYGLSGTNAFLETDVEPDGLNNLMEYALGGNPTNADYAAVAPRAFPAANGGTDWFYHVYNKRIDDPTLVYTLETDTDLVFAPGWDTNDVSFVGQSAESGGYSLQTNRTEAAANAKFIQLKVEK